MHTVEQASHAKKVTPSKARKHMARFDDQFPRDTLLASLSKCGKYRTKSFFCPAKGKRRSFSHSLTTKWRVGYIWCPRLTFFCLELFDWFFRGCWKYGPIIRKIIENVQLAVQQELSQKNIFFTISPPTLGSVAQSTHAWKFWSLQVFDSGRDRLRKRFWVPKVTCKNYENFFRKP